MSSMSVGARPALGGRPPARSSTRRSARRCTASSGCSASCYPVPRTSTSGRPSRSCRSSATRSARSSASSPASSATSIDRPDHRLRRLHVVELEHRERPRRPPRRHRPDRDRRAVRLEQDRHRRRSSPARRDDHRLPLRLHRHLGLRDRPRPRPSPGATSRSSSPTSSSSVILTPILVARVGADQGAARPLTRARRRSPDEHRASLSRAGVVARTPRPPRAHPRRDPDRGHRPPGLGHPDRAAAAADRPGLLPGGRDPVRPGPQSVGLRPRLPVDPRPRSTRSSPRARSAIWSRAISTSCSTSRSSARPSRPSRSPTARPRWCGS